MKALGIFIEYPWMALIVAGAFALLWHFRRRRSAAFAAVLWAGYASHEYLLYARILCTSVTVVPPNKFKDVPEKTELSDRISRDLLKRGFRFVGSTIVYAYLQAVGVVNDHLTSCFRHPKRQSASAVLRPKFLTFQGVRREKRQAVRPFERAQSNRRGGVRP